jgi:hemoglobin
MSFKVKLSGLFLAAVTSGALLASAPALAEDSLYNRLGGTYNIAQTVDHLVDKIYVNRGLNANPKLKAIHDRPETKAGFKVMLTNWVVQETGGPKIYTPDEFGRGKSMKDSHPHLNISNREFDIILTECLETFYAYNIPNHEISQLMADLESYRNVIVTSEKPVAEPTKK